MQRFASAFSVSSAGIALFAVGLEESFVNAADRAYPVIWNICKGSSGRNAAVGIADFGIVHIAARYTDPFFHNHVLRLEV